MYGNSAISLVVNVELYLIRESKYKENDLDILRKERTSNDQFIAATLKHKLYEFMPTDILSTEQLGNTSGQISKKDLAEEDDNQKNI